MKRIKKSFSIISQSIKTYLKESWKTFLSFRRFLKFDIIFAILFIISLTSPTVSAFTRTKFGYPVVFAVYMVWFVSCIIRHHKGGKKFLIDKSRIAEVICMVVWLVFISIVYLIGRGENGYWAIVYTIMFMTVYMIDYMYSIYNERSVLLTLVFVTLFVYAVHSLLSIFMLQNDPFLARYFNAYYFTDIALYAPLEYKGLGSYSFFTALAVSIPIFAYLITKTKHRIIATILYLVCIAGCFYSAYAGIIIIVMVSLFILLLFAFIFYKNKKRRRILISVLILSVILVVCLFSFMLPHPTNEMYKAKLRDLILAATEYDIAPNVPKNGEGDEDKIKIPEDIEISRFELYKVSFKTIIKHPLFGVGPYFKTATVTNGIGGHSSWLDYLAMYGFVGCMPLILFFLFYFRRTMQMSSYFVNKVMRLIPWTLFMGYGFVNPVFVAKNFPVLLMLLIAGSLPCGELVKFKDIFKSNKNILQ